MKFTFKQDIRNPDKEFDLNDWGFRDDLRNVFGVNDNYGVTKILRDRKVLTDNDEDDTESACTWVYFKSEKDARAFLRRLNAQPEIKNWGPPTKQRFILLKETEFNALQKLVKTMPKKYQTAIRALNIGIYDVQEHLSH